MNKFVFTESNKGLIQKRVSQYLEYQVGIFYTPEGGKQEHVYIPFSCLDERWDCPFEIDYYEIRIINTDLGASWSFPLKMLVPEHFE